MVCSWLHNLSGAEKTGWTSPDDAMLAYDKNANGEIDGITELFSEYMSETAEDGLEALAEYDSNSDGVFDANDTIFNDVRVWQDSNSNGVVIILPVLDKDLSVIQDNALVTVIKSFRDFIEDFKNDILTKFNNSKLSNLSEREQFYNDFSE